MPIEQTEFKFPDETVIEEETEKKQETPPNVVENGKDSEELKIEVVDDTPPEDRNREPMPKEIVEEIEKDDLEEYSDKVKRRLSQLKKVFHDERRAKEASMREAQEAVRFAQAKQSENQQLLRRMGEGEKIFKTEVTRAATSELAGAKAKLKAAYEAGDAEQIADAQEALTDAKLKLRDYERFQPSLQEDTIGVQSTQQARVPTQVVPDQRAKAWQEKNTWFGTDKEMTALALGLHEKLVESGVHPDKAPDEYYRQIEKTMRKRFPEYYEGDEPQKTPGQDSKPSTPPRKAANVVAPVTRSTAPRQVKLTPTQVSLAKRLGISNETYAREVLKLENSNG